MRKFIGKSVKWKLKKNEIYFQQLMAANIF